MDDRCCDARLGHLDRFVMHTVLQQLSGSDLRIAEVEHLIEQLIDQQEVLADRLFGQHTAVVFEDLRMMVMMIVMMMMIMMMMVITMMMMVMMIVMMVVMEVEEAVVFEYLCHAVEELDGGGGRDIVSAVMIGMMIS